MNDNQGRTDKELKEAGKMCFWAFCAVVVFILGSIIASIIEKI